MKKLASVMIAAIAVLSLNGCSAEKARTSDWYKENPEEIKKVQAKCKAENDKGYKVEGVLKENCAAARVATRHLIRNAIG
ncbi:EexN family lipoprotein [Psychrobacter sp. AOP22-C1-22]|uniref:EexN family lipoprotein n=1 Tax=unclassified Psychrobacter TaxID=196806 RepID=UPI0017883F3F|nr:EexN family lipoprotein [Psychrobacter sp. FME6]MBE0407931.1 EexN family lipoprotein [Psychrobacter sp. FME6]